MATTDLTKAKNAKNDEFYTQLADIVKEMNAYLDYNPHLFRGKTVLCPCDDPEWSNFTRYFAQSFELLGLKKLICTSFAVDSNNYKGDYQPTLFETSAPQFDATKTRSHGKLFILEHGAESKRVDINNLQWRYLEGDGDFRSAEVKPLRDEADFIVTNPPFSLFREFIAWIMGASKRFIVIGNKNCIAYKEVFPFLKDNKMWMGVNAVKEFEKPGGKTQVFGNVCWFTNVDHGWRHEPLRLRTTADNFKHCHHKELRGKSAYDHYDNYDAIDVPYVDAIPADYDGVMGVPITFLDRYCPEQFEIIGNEYSLNIDKGRGYVNGRRMYSRIFIKMKVPQ
jgi:hypothetical protein